MSNTKTRIISGLVLLLIVIFSVISGPKACLAFIGVIGLLVIDELIINFYDQRRNSKKYILAQVFYPMLFFHYLEHQQYELSLYYSIV